MLPCYDSKLPIPANVKIRFFLTDVTDPQILAAIPLDQIPATATIETAKLPPGDHVVSAQVLIESEASLNSASQFPSSPSTANGSRHSSRP